MMIMTMAAPEAPTTTANSHDAKPFAPTNSSRGEEVHEHEHEHEQELLECNTRSKSSNTSISTTSLNSSCSNDTDTSRSSTLGSASTLPLLHHRNNNATTNAMSAMTFKAKKGVSFSLQQTAYFSPEQILSKQERKNECWYSESELSISREEARMAIQALHHQLQLDATAATSTVTPATVSNGHGFTTPPPPLSSTSSTSTSTPLSNEYGSWVLQCPQDETKIVCLRGIEKYADAAAKYAGQKRLVDSVLQQQSLNNEDIHVALVSRTLSQPFKEVARYYAMKSAEELDLSRKLEQEREEQKQQAEVATVLLLIMGQQQQQHEQQHQQQQLQQSTSTPPTSIVTPRGSILGKRSSSFANSTMSENRNVKPCIQIDERASARVVR
mmetsp:Transcript_14014/g.29298  ORF Transcript_14014/g.29298 Transcript_14014/m.29298 type:complete len:384 (+) Transcript_14014:516-1667(+)